MQVLLTGAGGFTGHYVAEDLRRRGHGVHFFEADLTDPAATSAEVAKCGHLDAVIHLGAIAFVHDSNWNRFYQVNQIGTFHLLDAIASATPKAHVVLASSANVYGNVAAELLGEDAATRPANHYACSKLAMEFGAKLWSDRLDITIVRPFNYTGVGQENRYLVPKIVDHFRRRASTIELGNIDVVRDFGDVRAVAEAYVGLAERQPGGTFNIATATPHSIGDIISMCAELTGHQIDVRVNPDFVRAGEIHVLTGDPSRLKSVLPDWKLRPLRETVKWMLGEM